MWLKEVFQKHSDFSDVIKSYSSTREMVNKTEQSIATHREQLKSLQARKNELAAEFNEKWMRACSSFVSELEKVQEKTGVSSIFFNKNEINRYIPYCEKATITIGERGPHIITLKAEYEYRNPEVLHISEGCAPEIGLAPTESPEGFMADLILGTNAEAVNELTEKIIDAVRLREALMMNDVRNKSRILSETMRKDKESVNAYESKLEKMSRAGRYKYVDAVTRSCNDEVLKDDDFSLDESNTIASARQTEMFR